MALLAGCRHFLLKGGNDVSQAGLEGDLWLEAGQGGELGAVAGFAQCAFGLGKVVAHGFGDAGDLLEKGDELAHADFVTAAEVERAAVGAVLDDGGEPASEVGAVEEAARLSARSPDDELGIVGEKSAQ